MTKCTTATETKVDMSTAYRTICHMHLDSLHEYEVISAACTACNEEDTMGRSDLIYQALQVAWGSKVT